jgi:hypothetical protein
MRLSHSLLYTFKLLQFHFLYDFSFFSLILDILGFDSGFLHCIIEETILTEHCYHLGFLPFATKGLLFVCGV